MGTDVFAGMGVEDWLNRHLATLDPFCKDPPTQLLGEESAGREG